MYALMAGTVPSAPVASLTSSLPSFHWPTVIPSSLLLLLRQMPVRSKTAGSLTVVKARMMMPLSAAWRYIRPALRMHERLWWKNSSTAPTHVHWWNWIILASVGGRQRGRGKDEGRVPILGVGSAYREYPDSFSKIVLRRARSFGVAWPLLERSRREARPNAFVGVERTEHRFLDV